MNNLSWIKTIHTAWHKTGLNEDEYRALLHGAAGVNSSKEIQTYTQFNAVMQAFAKFGYVHLPGLYQQRWGCTVGQQRAILALWKKVGRHQEQQSLAAFCKHVARVDNPRFLTMPLAQDVIIALEKMQEKIHG